MSDWKERLREHLLADVRADWDEQREFWLRIREKLQTWVSESNEKVLAGAIVEAAEYWSVRGVVYDFIKHASALDQAFELDPGVYPVLPESLFIKDNLKLEDTGPVRTGLRYAVRSGDEEFRQRCERIIVYLEASGDSEVGSWLERVVIEAARQKEVEERETAAQRAAKSSRNKALVAALAIVLFIVLAGAGLYQRDWAAYEVALDAEPFDPEALQIPLLPPAFFPGVPERLAALTDVESLKADARLQAADAIFRMEAALSTGAAYVEVMPEFSEAQLAFAAAVADLAPSDYPELNEQRRELIDRLDSLEAAALKTLAQWKVETLSGIRTALDRIAEEVEPEVWVSDLPYVSEALTSASVWSPDERLFSQAWTVAERDELRIQENRLSSMLRLASSWTEAQTSLIEAKGPEAVEDALRTMRRLAESGAPFLDARMAENSLSLWERARSVSLASVLGLEDRALLRNDIGDWNLKDLSMSPVGAARVNALLQNEDLQRIQQAFLNTYQGIADARLVYISGDITTEQQLVDDLRQIFLINQSARIWSERGFEERRYTANRDGLGRIRGQLLEDGIAAPESALLMSLAEIWDTANSTWTESPVGLIERGVSNEQLSPAFRIFLARWTVRAFQRNQKFFPVEWQEGLMTLESNIEAMGLNAEATTWLSEGENQRAYTRLLDQVPMESWTLRQSRVLERLEQLSKQNLVLDGYVYDGKRVTFEGNEPADGPAYLVHEPDAPLSMELEVNVNAEICYPRFVLISQ